MNPQANIVARAAITEAASAIQDIVRAFTNDRTPAAQRNDLVQARERLLAATDNVKTAIQFLT